MQLLQIVSKIFRFINLDSDDHYLKQAQHMKERNKKCFLLTFFQIKFACTGRYD
jgi:hypothetical protein